MALNLEEIRDQLRVDLRETGSEAKRKKYVKRLKIVEAFIESGALPEWMILDVIPVIPPDCARWCRWTVAGSRPRI